MKLNSIGKNVGKPFGMALSAAAIAALTLSACGSDNNTGSSGNTAGGNGSSSAECGGKNSLTAEGSTAQQNAIAEFNKVWGQTCSGKNLSYNPTGSGAGREQFIAGNVDFAGSDSALKDEQIAAAAERCGGNPAWNLPLVFGPIAMAYNIPGVDKLVLNGDTLAKIFQGQITKWNDPAIAATERGRHAARHRRHPDLPVGLLGHHRQLPEVPRGRFCRGVDQGRRQRVPGRRR